VPPGAGVTGLALDELEAIERGLQCWVPDAMYQAHLSALAKVEAEIARRREAPQEG